MERLYDQWNPRDLNNKIYSNFKYTPLRGLRRFHLPRRDPTKVIKVGDRYVSGIRETSSCDPVGLKMRQTLCRLLTGI